jgi:ABC-type amino acid transport substrate-binding protein
MIKNVTQIVIAMFALTTLLKGTVMAETTIRIGTEGNWKPFSYQDSQGNLLGFEVDLVRSACEKANVKCEFVVIPFDGLIPALQEKKIDAVASGIRSTPKRQKVVDFVTPYYLSKPVFSTCTKKNLSDNLPQTLAGLTVGVQTASTHVDYLKERHPELIVRLYKSTEEINADLLAGRIDIGLHAMTSTYDFLRSEKGKECVMVGETITDKQFYSFPSGIAVRKGDTETLESLDVGVKMLLSDGTFEELNAKYWPFSIKYVP